MSEDSATAYAWGEDRSNFQTVAPWAGLDFGYCKVSESTTYADPTFAGNWARMHSDGLVWRAGYHFLHPSVNAVAQANFCVDRMQAQGMQPGDGLVIDAEIFSGEDGAQRMSESAARRSHLLMRATDGQAIPRPGTDYLGRAALPPLETSLVGNAVLGFGLRAVARLGPQHPVVVYTDESVAAYLGNCTRFGLIIAYYAGSPPPSVSPWKSYLAWQYAGGGGRNGGDRDRWNGTRAQLASWVGGYKPKPPAPSPAPSPVTPPPAIEDNDMPNVEISTGTDVGVSFDGRGKYKTVGFLADPGRVGSASIVVRAAFHDSGSSWEVSKTDVTITAAAPKQVITVPATADGVSFHRLDTVSDIVLYPNFA